ncbi:hypothetical protein KY284_007318 [Solanum tuberosum]|nr:hypothetical protein KY284_007318 [Solanum tuberosum]
MAYAALSSLMYTLEQLFKPNQSFVCPCSTQQHVQSLYENLSALQLFLDNTTTNDIETLKVVEKRIRNVVYKAEEKVDSSLGIIILLADCTEMSEGACKFFEEELVKVEKDVDSLRKEVVQIESNEHGSKSAELATTPSSPEKRTIEENTIVGMEDDFNIILDRLTSQIDELTVIPIFGMGGIGKTALARKAYDDSYIRSRFDKHAWVTVSEKYNQKQMLLELVSSITGSKQEMRNDQLMEIVYRGLKGRRFLIVIDDIWSTKAWDQMQRTFPNDDNRSRILLTTRLKYVADYVSCPDFPPHKTGKHIVQQCQGLPLSVVVVAGLLGKMDLTHDNWKKVEENLNSFFGTVSERFSRRQRVNVSKLIRLWIAEQFIKARSNKSKQRANGRIETCKIHDLLRQLCLSEAHTENIVYFMNGNVLVSLLEVIHDQRRVIGLRKHEEKQFKLLKVLDVLSVWYDISSVIPELVHLRYVAARIEGDLSLAKSRNLQTIILVGFEQMELDHPLDIWRMTEIRHLDIEWPLYISNHLEAENNSIGEQPLFLNNLHTLTLQFSPFSAEIIRRTPNLKKLKMCEISDYPSIPDSLILLEELETLKIEVNSIDPSIFSGDVFPPNLKKLTLSNTKIPWEVMNLLSNLANLEVLKGYYAFAGTDWTLNV